MKHIWYTINVKNSDKNYDGVFISTDPFDFLMEIRNQSSTFEDVQLINWKVLTKEQYNKFLKNFAITF